MTERHDLRPAGAGDSVIADAIPRPPEHILAELRAEWRDAAVPPSTDPPTVRLSDPPPAPNLASVVYERFQKCCPPEAADADDEPTPSGEVASMAARLHLDSSSRDPRPALPTLARHLPDVGDEIMGFRLLAELGRGAFARVFLA